MLKIRLARIGTKKRPFYRVVAVDERQKRTGAYVELLGTYNPLTEPKDVKLNQERIDYWIKKGAQPSDGYLRMIGKAPQRPPRKPKKEKKEEPEESGVKNPEEKAEETSKSSEAEVIEKTPANTSDGGPEGDSSEVNESEQKIARLASRAKRATEPSAPRNDKTETK